MKTICIFGLGYVGSVSLGCLASRGHRVIGIDISEAKVELINKGKSPIIEKDLERLIAEGRANGTISATGDVNKALEKAEAVLICVGTPPTSRGHLNLDGIFRAAGDIARGIAKRDDFPVIAIRSTVLPGTNQQVAEIIEKNSGRKNGRDFAVVSNPEFLREGTAVRDYFHPSFTLVGSSNPRAVEVMTDVYHGIEAPLITTDIRIAELIKYINNSFHALKISFANEVGAVCKVLGIDSHELMSVFCQDTKLNISPAYLKPGFAYGGSCLPKDLKALGAIAHEHYLKCPVLEHIDASNEAQKVRVLDRILDFGKQRIGFLGLSFKEGTDDLRSSPIIDILEKMLGRGYDIKIFDRNVHISKLVGANLDFILERIPFISKFVTDDPAEVLAHSEVIVVVNKESEFVEILEKSPRETIIFDLVNIDFQGRLGRDNYFGLAW